jgi:polar amino acid transport system substrate-binding protein
MKKIIKGLLIILAVAMLLATASACRRTASRTGLTIEPGILIMATNAEFPPYEFWEGGRIVGIDPEIAEAIANKLGLTLRIDDMDFGAILAAVTAGRADMAMAGLTVTEERMQSVDFSTSYATGVQVIIVRDGSPIRHADDLRAAGARFNIGVQESTTGDLYTTWDLEDEGLATIHRFRRGADAVQALITGRVDCVVIDNEPARAFVAMNRGLHILETEFAVENYAIAFAKGNPLRDAVDNALRELIADGTVQRVIDKYITVD